MCNWIGEKVSKNKKSDERKSKEKVWRKIQTMTIPHEVPSEGNA